MRSAYRFLTKFFWKHKIRKSSNQKDTLSSIKNDQITFSELKDKIEYKN